MARLKCLLNQTPHMFTAGRSYDATPAGHKNMHWQVKDDHGHTRFILGDDLQFCTGHTPLIERFLGDSPLYARFEVEK